MTQYTDAQLRSAYLKDLQLPDTFHGRDTPKVRYITPWTAIDTRLRGEQRHINPFEADVWVWSDIHLGHKNIIKYTAPHRPYASVEQMNESLITNYFAVVKPGDIVIWGGDIGFMSVNNINAILDTLHGYNVWIVGNHDLHRDGTVYDLSFHERHLCKVVDIVEPDGFKYQIWITHYPMDNVPRGVVNLHGHIHQNQANAWNINMCVEHTNCSPMNMREVCSRARRYLETQI